MQHKTIQESNFVSYLNRDDWHQSQEIELLDTIQSEVVDDDKDPEALIVDHAFGVGRKTSRCGDLTIISTESFNYDLYQPETFSASSDGLDDALVILYADQPVKVVDEDGDELSMEEIEDLLPCSFTDIDFSNFEIAETQDIDVDEDADMETITLEIDNAPDIRFTGEKIAGVRSGEDGGRWTELDLYRTKGGKYVCHQIGRTIVGKERDRYKGVVCTTMSEVIDFFGHRWLAKELYEDAGIEDVQEVD